jgi:hypothetical protein
MALATANPAALRARAETAPRPYWVWSGYAAFILGVLFTWAPAFFGVSEAESKDPDRLCRALDTTTHLWIGRVSSGLGFLAVAAVIVFATGYRRFLEARMKDSLVPAVAFTALVATAGALIVAAIFRAMLFDSIDYYDNSVHAAFYALSWDVSLAAWTVTFLAAGASAVAAFRGFLPRWFGWFSAVFAGLGIALAMVGLSFPAHMPAFIWLLGATTLVFVLERREA